jgi:hypothetical protein
MRQQMREDNEDNDKDTHATDTERDSDERG